MIGRPRRLVLIGSVVADVILQVPQLPERGGDVLATGALVQAGGGFNVLAAAARLGLPCALVGHVGTGPMAQLVRGALREEGVRELLPPAEGEQGFCVGAVEPDGERTFLTSPGVESRLGADDLAVVALGADDAVYVSGYDLLYPGADAIVTRLGADARDGVGEALLLLDPGPLVAEIPDALMDGLLGRVDVLSLNAREARLLSGIEPAEGDTQAVGTALLGLLREESVVLLREGSAGATLFRRGRAPERVPGLPVADVVDTTGAGDTHSGAFLAELARGADLVEAVRVANVAAALSVRRPVSAGGPTRPELDAALRA